MARKSDALITGAQCQYARNKLGITQARLAKEVGVSRAQIANFETKGERFTPSEEVRQKLRDYFEDQLPGIETEWPDAVSSSVGNDDTASGSSGVRSSTMRYVQALSAAGCFRMSAELSEKQRDRLLDEIEKVRSRLEEIASTEAKPGVFDPYDGATDELIGEADGLIKKFGFLCIVAFGYGFITVPTNALLERKKKPSTIADALALKYAGVFKDIGIKKNATGDAERDNEVESEADA